MRSLPFTGERSDIAAELTAAGWQTCGLAVEVSFARNGIDRIPVNDGDLFTNLTYVSATLSS